MYHSGVGEMYDIAETRRALQARRSELLAECTANSRLQQRFDQIAAQLSTANHGSSGSSAGGARGAVNRASVRTGVPVQTEPADFPDVAQRHTATGQPENVNGEGWAEASATGTDGAASEEK
jgi:hypothetical protein